MNRPTALGILSAMEGADAPGIASRLTPDARFWPPISATTRSGMDRPVQGAEQIAALFTRGKHFKQIHGTVLHCLADGDHVAVHTQMCGTTPAGKDYDAGHLWLFRFEGDLVAEAWEYADTSYAFERLGI